jgi:AcrR family transcriptional regulator
VGRPTLHTEQAILDAARGVVLKRGTRATTVAAIAHESGAPIGSIYHRFSSVDELLARLWIRAARRAQNALLAALAGRDDVEALVEGALAVYDFCLHEPEDALVLGSFGLNDFDQREFPVEVQRDLATVNDPIAPIYAELASRFGDSDGFDTVHFILVDLPFGVARRHLQAGSKPPLGRRGLLSAAVRAAARARQESLRKQED